LGYDYADIPMSIFLLITVTVGLFCGSENGDTPNVAVSFGWEPRQGTTVIRLQPTISGLYVVNDAEKSPHIEGWKPGRQHIRLAATYTVTVSLMQPFHLILRFNSPFTYYTLIIS
jgi:hypothetical protein